MFGNKAPALEFHRVMCPRVERKSWRAKGGLPPRGMCGLGEAQWSLKRYGPPKDRSVLVQPGLMGQ